MSEIKKKTHYKQLHKFYRHLIHPNFKDKEYINIIAASLKDLRSSFENEDISVLTLVGLVLSLNQIKLTADHQQFAREIVELSLRIINENQNTVDFRLLSYSFTVLSQIEINDTKQYGNIFTAFENNCMQLSEIHFSILIKKVFGLILKLKSNPKQIALSKVLTKRL